MNIRGNNPMTTAVTFKLSQEERELIEQYAFRNSMTISEAIRDILERHVKEKKENKNGTF